MNTDVYASIADQPADVVASLVERLEVRGRDLQQRRLWGEYLDRVALVGTRVLEVGCGTGVVCELLAERVGDGEVVGLDPSPVFLERARERCPGVRFEVGDARALPFEAGRFDVVVFSTTLCHVPQPEQALVEAARVLRPGGTLVVYDGDYGTTSVAVATRDPLQACAESAVQTLVHDPWFVRRLRPLTAAAGFRVGALHSHGYVETESPAYALNLIDLGAGVLVESGVLDPATAEALSREARLRVEQGRFHCFIGYASLVATKP